MQALVSRGRYHPESNARVGIGAAHARTLLRFYSLLPQQSVPETNKQKIF